MAVFLACTTLVTCVFCRRLRRLPRGVEPGRESLELELFRDDEDRNAGGELRQLTDISTDEVVLTSDSEAKCGNLGKKTTDEVDQKRNSTPKRVHPTLSTADEAVWKSDIPEKCTSPQMGHKVEAAQMADSLIKRV